MFHVRILIICTILLLSPLGLALAQDDVAPPGAPVALHYQGGSNQLDALFVDKNGAVNVMWVVRGGTWQGPTKIS